jgi:hypothetical protein
VSGFLAGPRRGALIVVTVLVTASTLVAFGESYRALYLWAARHGVPYGWALVWPAMVDVFIAVGELALFVGLADRWPWRSRVFPWLVTLAGLAVSVAANVGHVASSALTWRATAAVPPLAAAAALAVGLGVLKRVVAHHHAAAGFVTDHVTNQAGIRNYESGRDSSLSRDESVAVPEAVPAVSLNGSGLHPAEAAPFAEELARGEVPGIRRIRAELHVGQPRAREIQARLAVLARTP